LLILDKIRELPFESNFTLSNIFSKEVSTLLATTESELSGTAPPPGHDC